MWKSLLAGLTLGLVWHSTAGAQTIVFADAFNRADTTDSVGNGWVAGGSGRARIINNEMEVVARSSSGHTYATQAMSGFAAPWSTVLAQNTGLVTWTLNLRTTRNDPSGLESGVYGGGFVLAGTSSDLTAGNGYALVFGQVGEVDPIRLVRYTGGLDADANVTNLITADVAPMSDFGSNFLSLKVTYDPSSHTWQFYGRSDGYDQATDPLTGTLTLLGTVVDSTYTGASMTSIGAKWNHGTATSSYLTIDNLVISVGAAHAPEPTGAVLLALAGAGLLVGHRRR